jgi:hypothetical protein
MAGMQGIGGQNNFRIGQGGMDPLGQGQQQGGIQDAMKLLKQLAEQLGLDPQSGGKCQGGQCQGAGGSKGAGGEGSGGDLEDLLKKLRELAQKNPAALQAALQQMPGLASALQGAMMGSGGGASGAGMAAAA